MKTLVILALIALPSLCFAEEPKVRWDITGNRATPYLVDRDSSTGQTKVFNLDTGEVGINRPGFGTIQTGKRPDNTMDVLLNEPAEDGGDE